MENKVTTEILIIGSGPAGLAAAIYAYRANRKAIILDKGTPGGKINIMSKIQNYPGVEEISGPDLAQMFVKQASSMGVSVAYGEVLSVSKIGEVFVTHTDDGEYESSAVIVASGTSERKLGIPGEDKFIGRGVSYCATCDAAFYKGEDVVVIGNGTPAAEEALHLADVVKKVYMIDRHGELAVTPILLDRIKAKKNIEVRLNAVTYQIKGQDKVSSVMVREENEYELSVKAVFPFVGSIPNTSFVVDKSILDKNGYIICDAELKTTIPGLFAAGDVVDKALRQIVTAASDGAIAATSAAKYLRRR